MSRNLKPRKPNLSLSFRSYVLEIARIQAQKVKDPEESSDYKNALAKEVERPNSEVEIKPMRSNSAAAVNDEFLHVHPDQQDEAAAAVVAVAAVAVAVASPHPQLVDRMAASR
ncbi:hypothetical protein LWI29_024417 [Acer saccharum]|uniref:Uncharacterized protein n=1 Tax=Acer saccharum TaxID=4024 RepID=A0AA39SMX5_ACESA|nr:hypothetical protein LWI29_024417 [Acer saccharum]